MPITHPHQTDSLRTIRMVWQDREASATVLLTLLIDAFGTEALSWTPQTIIFELEMDFGVKLSDRNLAKLMAGIHILTSDEFYRNLPTFNDMCVVLAGGAHQPGVFVPADAAECAWGITEVLMLHPLDEDEPFDEDIRHYVGAALKDEGIIKPPDVLGIAIHDQELARQVSYDYSDDPEMSSAIWGAEKEKTDDINRFVRDKLEHVLRTLESLPLHNGNADQMAKKMLQSLPS